MARPPTLLSSVRKGVRETRDTVELVRRTRAVIDDIDKPPPGAHWRDQVKHAARNLLRSAGREVLYALWVPLLLLLIVIANLLALAALFWLIGFL